MSSDDKPPLHCVVYGHWMRAALYHPTVVSFKIGPNRQGRQIYARAMHSMETMCCLDFHYLDDNTRVYGLKQHFGLYATFGQKHTPAEPIGPDIFDNVPQCHYMATQCSYVICDVDSKEVLARIDFHPITYSTKTGRTQAPGAIIDPAELVFKSVWDDPVNNPTEEHIEEDYNRGIIRYAVTEREFLKLHMFE